VEPKGDHDQSTSPDRTGTRTSSPIRSVPRWSWTPTARCI